jgi:oxaloacetate decarboxylase alpha subunit
MELWVQLAKNIESMGADSIAIKDMAGLLKPYVAFELVSRLKKELSIPIHMQSHATTGMSTATALKAIEAGIDNIDTAISSMSMTYGHSPTESVVAMLQDTDRDTGLNIVLLEEIAGYFREVRKKYAQFEGSLRGVDSRILVAQVPGGMLTNMESQLKDQGAADKMDQVLEEIPRVREDLGFIPLVTPTSQIVGTQAVMNVMFGERYKSISKETAGVLKGEYGLTPAPVHAQLQARVLEGAEPITCRPADLLEPEVDKLSAQLRTLASEKSIQLAAGDNEIDDILTYALFPEIGLKFLQNRGNPDAFEPVPSGAEPVVSSVAPTAPVAASGSQVYTVAVAGHSYVVEVSEGGDVQTIAPQVNLTAAPMQPAPLQGEPLTAPLAGNIFKVNVAVGEQVQQGDVIIILEAMKMETEVRSLRSGAVASVNIKEGDTVSVGDILITIA